MAWDSEDVQLVPISWLKPHEEINVRGRDKLLDMTKRWKGYTKPLLVDSETGTILDGHHRYSIGLVLNLRRLPAICVNYLQDENVSVSLWPGSDLESITKDDVINMALSGKVYPPKTSKHELKNYLPPIHVLLDILLKESD
ncbi:MAG: ParB N-terminal domain-containing protein [Candidatus Poseidoniaceae archaeon]|jgi:hypothetical protein|nr:ParB N-terminal domain-containing protein [Candidatus Poseidoniaceae archaeon]